MILKNITYLRVYKPHFFDKNLPSEIGVLLIHGILWCVCVCFILIFIFIIFIVFIIFIIIIKN
jgi:hypothetical protein